MTIRKYFLQPASSLPISATLPYCKYSGNYYFLIVKSDIYKSVLLTKCLYSLEIDYFFPEAFCFLELSDLTFYFSSKFLAIFFFQFSFLFLLVQVEFTKILILRFISTCIKFSSLDYCTKLILQPDTKIQ